MTCPSCTPVAAPRDGRPHQGSITAFVPPSPAEQGEQAVRDAAGKVARRSRGQGFQLEQEVKAAVEALAMNMATEFDSKDWDVEDVHGTETMT